VTLTPAQGHLKLAWSRPTIPYNFMKVWSVNYLTT